MAATGGSAVTARLSTGVLHPLPPQAAQQVMREKNAAAVRRRREERRGAAGGAASGREEPWDQGEAARPRKRRRWVAGRRTCQGTALPATQHCSVARLGTVPILNLFSTGK